MKHKTWSLFDKIFIKGLIKLKKKKEKTDLCEGKPYRFGEEENATSEGERS